MGDVGAAEACDRQMLLPWTAVEKQEVGVIAVGGSPVDSIQYELINKQFDCMADYLSWDMLFQKSYYASEKTDLCER